MQWISGPQIIKLRLIIDGFGPLAQLGVLKRRKGEERKPASIFSLLMLITLSPVVTSQIRPRRYSRLWRNYISYNNSFRNHNL